MVQIEQRENMRVWNQKTTDSRTWPADHVATVVQRRVSDDLSIIIAVIAIFIAYNNSRLNDERLSNRCASKDSCNSRTITQYLDTLLTQMHTIERESAKQWQNNTFHASNPHQANHVCREIVHKKSQVTYQIERECIPCCQQQVYEPIDQYYCCHWYELHQTAHKSTKFEPGSQAEIDGILDPLRDIWHDSCPSTLECMLSYVKVQ
jgi:hypothetical protein